MIGDANLDRVNLIRLKNGVASLVNEGSCSATSRSGLPGPLHSLIMIPIATFSRTKYLITMPTVATGFLGARPRGEMPRARDSGTSRPNETLF